MDAVYQKLDKLLRFWIAFGIDRVSERFVNIIKRCERDIIALFLTDVKLDSVRADHNVFGESNKRTPAK